MAANVVFLDRVLTGYGPETGTIRARVREAVEELTHQSTQAPKSNTRVNPGFDTQTGNAVYLAIQALTPQNDTQRDLKAQAATLALELGKLRTLLVAESISSISMPLLVVVVFWIVVIFLSFCVIAPRNLPAMAALIVSAISAAAAIFLLLELDHPLSGGKR